MSLVAPKWAETLVKYLILRVIPKKMSKKRKRYFEKYTENCFITTNQCYNRGKDGNLRICVIEREYVPILTHAHSYVFKGHFFAGHYGQSTKESKVMVAYIVQRCC